MPLDRETMLSDIIAWRDEDEGKRRGELRSIATLLDLSAVTKWSDLSDHDLARLYRAVFAADYRTDDEFDKQINF